MCLPGGKELHLRVFVFGFHFAVYHRDSEVREFVAYISESVFEVNKVRFFIFFDEWVNDIYLSSLRNLL